MGTDQLRAESLNEFIQENPVSRPEISRRSLFGASALGVASAAAAALADPGQAAAQAAGVKKADLPDLTIKEVKVYVANLGNVRRLNSSETGEIVSIVTNSGVEGNMTIGNRGNPPGFLEYAKGRVLGKSALDVASITPVPNTKRFSAYGALSTGRGGFGGPPPGGAGRAGGGRGGAAGAAGAAGGPPSGIATPAATAPAGGRGGRGGGGGGMGGGGDVYQHDAIIDVCLWDILGKAVNRPIYKLLGGTKTRVMAYASSQHLPYVEDFAPDVLKARAAGIRGYKIHPGGGQSANAQPRASYIGHMEEIRQVRKAVGDDYPLMFDPVQGYNVYSALKVGRLLEDEGYIAFEDPIPTTDIEGLIVLARALDVPLNIGEFIMNMNGFADYIKRDALDIVRFIADNIGGITGGVRVCQLAAAFGMECQPHNWGNVMDLAVHFQLELAADNNYWFEMPWPMEYADRVYHKDKFRVDQDGYIHAPTEPGLGYPIDRDALDKIMVRVDK
jgi:L-alanine-DL-glutamate epimerase-like enolase superfamily enzyme